ncbi:diadenylate cyclase CdaA [Candidatus Ruminimicrobiellum ovillum]|uniref:diadenylate cyclase CdaA n=1 Tax=Candidatus Ruminimicrobiellum ovillum TaxID=1947927 RepID=UPI003559ADEE
MELVSHIWNVYIVNILDILILTYIFYRILLVIKGTRTIQIVIGLIVLVAITIIARDVLHLKTLSWLMSRFWLAAVVILAVVFQSEIRYALAKIGSKLFFVGTKIKSNFISEIVEAATEMSRIRMGALIVLEKDMGLKNYTETGIKLDAKVTHELLLSIFNTKAPIHDGAVIIKDEKIEAAGCVLPISTEIEVKHLGTRHRAGIGLSALTDAIVLVVSEETGNISICVDGEIEKVSSENLLEVLTNKYTEKAIL